MKTIILLLVMVLGFAGQSWGQENKPPSKKERSQESKTPKKNRDKNFVDKTQIIIYDFKTHDYVKPIQRVKVHTPVIFKIKNINPFAYNVVITHKDSVLARSSFDADVFKALTVKAENQDKQLEQSQTDINKSITNHVQPATQSEYLGKDEEEKNTHKKEVESINGVVIYTDKIQNLKTELAKTEATIAQLNIQFKIDSTSNFQKANNFIIQKQDLNDEIAKLKNDSTAIDRIQSLQIEIKGMDAKLNELNLDSLKINPDTLELSKKKEKLHDEICRTKKALEQLKVETQAGYAMLLKDFLDNYAQYMEDSRKVFKKVRLTKLIAWIAEQPNLTYTNVQDTKLSQLAKELETDVETINDYRKSYTDLSNVYYKMMATHKLDNIMEPSGVTKTLGYPQFLKTKADQISEVLAKYQLDDVIKKTIWVASILNDVESFNTKSNPVQPENDLVQFTIEIKKRNEKDLDQYYTPKNFTYQQPTYGGTRVDFSLGLTASHYTNVSSYSISKTNTINVSRKDMIFPSLIGLVTMSGRKTGYFAFGGSAGMGVDIASGKVQLSNFFVGPTLLMGKKDRIFFTVGASLKNIRELKDDYKDVVVPANTSDFSSFTRDYYKVGVFASLTYSLTKDAKAMIKNLR